MNSIRVQMALLDTAGALAAFAANWLLQSTLLIVAGLTLAWLVRRRGAAIQSAIYRTTLAAVVVCPLATLVLSLNGVSGWSLPMPAAWRYEELESPALETPDEAIAVAPLEVSEPTPGEFAQAGSADFDRRAFERMPDETWRAARAPLPSAGSAGQPSSEPEPVIQPNDAASVSTIPVLTVVFEVFAFGVVAVAISCVWIMGAMLLVSRLARSWRRLRRMLRKAIPAEMAVQDACQQAAALVGVAAPRVLSSPYATSPCLVAAIFCRERGALWAPCRSANGDTRSMRGARNGTESVPYSGRAVILLPELTPALPLRDVLIHELAHLRRGDAGWNLLARLCEALFFFQPLIWLLSRRLEASAEDVCDDYVVQFGGDRSQYARGLLEIAELSTTPIGATAVAMVSLRSILARRVTRILDPSRSLSTRAGNLLLALVIAGGLAGATIVGFVGLGSHPPAVAEPAADAAEETQATGTVDKADKDAKPSEPAAEAKQESDKNQPGAGNELRGTIIGADGKPVAGAKLYWIRSRMQDLKPPAPRLMATTGKEGTFRFVEPPPVEPTLPASWGYVDRIAITAPGHGFAFTSADEMRRDMAPPDGVLSTLAHLVAGRARGATRLPVAGEPIRGRLIDVNGQPVVGATVRIRWFNGENDIGGAADLKARAASLLGTIEPVQLRDVLPSATTDANGRFELRDIGQQRLVQLLVQGEGIEATEIIARNEPGEKIVVDATWQGPGESIAIYPNSFAYAVGPSKPVEGRVLDFDTGKPIAGAVVRAFRVHNQPITTSQEREHFSAVTDDKGRYRLAGLPLGKGNTLVAFATGDVAYLPVGHAADTSLAGAAIARDFRLKRGVWAEGRVFDAENDKPFVGEVRYYFFRNREFEEAVDGLGEAFVDGIYWTNANGEYRAAVLPSRGILAFQYGGYSVGDPNGMDRFRRGFGAEEIAGTEDFGGGKVFATLPHTLMPENYERVAEVPATTDQETVRVDMPLFASRPVTVSVRADGALVTKFAAYGANERWQWQDHEGPDFDIQDLRPGERRKVFVFQRASNLAGGGFVEYGAEQAVQIDLVKAGSLKGRLVDADGAPIDDAMVVVDYEKLRSDDNSALWARHPDLAVNPTKLPIDKNGHFRLDGLIPGWTYHAYVSAPRPRSGVIENMFVGKALQGVQVAAGEVKDLGDVVVGDDKSATADVAKNSAVGRPARPPDAKDGLAGRPTNPPTDDLVTVSGTVVSPDGKPFADAKLYAVRVYWEPHIPHPPLAETKSDEQGRFTISYRKSQFTANVGREDQWKEVSIVATADGFAPGWITWRDIPKGKEVALRLVADDVPIAGRVVDLEGKPVAGVTVRVGRIHFGKGGNLDGWLAAVRRGEFPWTAAEHLADSLPQFDGWPPSVVTGDDGRFRVNGIGRERRVDLSFSGPAIAYHEVEVVTRRSDMFPLRFSGAGNDPTPVYGAEFELVAPPTQAITGIVRDAKTRQPLAGVSIESNMFAGTNVINRRKLRAVSDAEGRYRLVGMPKGAGNRILAVPNDDQPYLMLDVKVPESRGLAPINVDIDLHRGIWITGRVTDMHTGGSIVARLHYLPFLTNDFARQTPEFGEPGSADGFQDRYVSRPDGAYRLVGLPGRAIVGAECVIGRYRKGVGAEQIAGMNQQGNFETHFNPVPPGKKWPNAMKEINPSPDTETVVCDLALDPGEKLTVNVVDPDGKPLNGFETQGSGQLWHDSRELHGRFDVITLGPDETRTVIVRHKDRKLGKVLRVRFADHPSGSLAVAVEPAAKITGRLVDRQGAPISGAAIETWVSPIEDFGERLPTATTDEQGRFEVADVPVGCTYDLDAQAAGIKQPGWFAGDVAVEAGQTKDLGEVVYGAAMKSAAKKPATAPPKQVAAKDGLEGRPTKASTDDLITVTGTVVDPRGKPFAGAKLYAVRWYWEPHGPRPPLADTASDERGRFTISYRKFAADIGREDPWKDVAIVAIADGFGAAWISWQDLPRGKEATLRLSDDAPIVGRVVDLEGNPVAGVNVRVGNILSMKNGNLDGWLAAVQRGEFASTTAQHFGDELPRFDGWPPPAATGEDGRFRINGIGREHKIRLSFNSPKIAYQEIEVVTRRSDVLPLKLGDEARGWGLAAMIYGPEFELVVPPTQPITGIVRDAKTRQPLAGVTVESNRFAGNNSSHLRQLKAVSDAEGRYRLIGLPKRAGNHVLAVPNDEQPYLMRDVEVPESPGLGPIQLDIDLHRGVWITGRVTDLRSGAGVVAQLHYHPFLSNSYAQQTPEFGIPRTPDGFDTRYMSRPDGGFRLVGLPGRAIVGAECVIGRYRQGVGAEEIAGMNEHGDFDTYPNPILPGKKWPNAIKEINPPPDAEMVRCDLALDPGEKVTIDVVDRDGKPVDGFEAEGAVQACYDTHDLNGRLDVVTLAPDETRIVIIRHKDRKLGKVVRVKVGEHPSDSFTVVLEPLGKIVGRLIDRQGAPIGGAAITALVTPRPLHGFQNRLPPAATDADGRFEYTDLPTGCTFDLDAQAVGLKQAGWLAKDVAVEAGQTKDLGDMVYGAVAKQNPQSSANVKPTGKSTGDKMQERRKVMIRGRVLLPDGKPAAGADLYWARIASTQPHSGMKVDKRGATDADGHFEFELTPANLPATPVPISLVAHKDGLGRRLASGSHSTSN